MANHAPIEKYFRVLSLQGTTDGRASERDMLLGYADDEDGMVPFTNPDMPLEDVYWVEPWDGRNMDIRDFQFHYKPFAGAIRMEVLNSGLDKKDQVWKRIPVPMYWQLRHLSELAMQNKWTIRRGGKVVPDLDKFRDANLLTDEQYDFAVREWHRRIYGVWIWIGGKLTYLTGGHYYYLTYFKIDTGYPGYRDRDRRWFYVAQAVFDSEDCLGLVYLKHRRDGATYRCCCVGLEISTRGHMPEANFGIMSKDDDTAKSAFKTKVVNPFQSLPFFFTPMVKDKTDVEKILEFKAPPRSVSERHLADQTGLGATIEYKAKGKKGIAGFDSQKLHFLLMDEVGKKKDVSVMDELGLVTPTMDLDGLLGKIFAATTNEELDGVNKDEFQKMWDRSDLALIKSSQNGETKTKLWRYFTPAYDGLNASWVGRFGESIIDMPTDEQMEFLMSLPPKFVRRYEKHWKRGGSYSYLMRERADKSRDGSGNASSVDDDDDNTLVGFIRKFPFTPEESFTQSNPDSDYNIANCNRAQNLLKEVTATGNLLVHDLTIRGNLEWYDEIFKDRVKFVPHADGRFLVSRDYMPGGKLSNQLRITNEGIVRTPARQGKEHLEKHGSCKPGSDTWIVIGTDPQKTAKVDMKKGRRYSSASAHGFYPYRYEMEKVEWVAQLEEDPDFAKDWITNAFIFEYNCHPKNPEQHHEDMLKACFYWNAKILYERQVNELGAYFTKAGCRSFLITDEKWIKKLANGKEDKSKENAVPGLSSSEAVIGLYKDRTKAFIDYFLWPNKCPFLLTIGQWIEFKVEIIEKLDAQVSSGYALLAANPGFGPIRKEQKKADIAPDPRKPKMGVRGLTRLYT